MNDTPEFDQAAISINKNHQDDRVSVVEGACFTLQDELDRLGNQIDQLGAKIAPILGPSYATPSDPNEVGDDSPERSHLTGELEKFSSQIRNFQYAITSLIDRAEV